MPGRDGTGPWGMGQLSGGGWGPCGRAWGWRCGPGWGRGSAFYSAGFSREELLQERKRILEKELARINEELEPAEHD
ncbi:MAG TPA: DUF5320 domain-containing protein [Firmicutes bacterium]|jgi:hypothetical protein|nr:DUF5320 domain-containing protein [Bacillota bacterium]HHT43531.1 DUF5320 domain-containing protein [Bacillota bacterium]